jgi:hypothetical protein
LLGGSDKPTSFEQHISKMLSSPKYKQIRDLSFSNKLSSRRISNQGVTAPSPLHSSGLISNNNQKNDLNATDAASKKNDFPVKSYSLKQPLDSKIKFQDEMRLLSIEVSPGQDYWKFNSPKVIETTSSPTARR